MSLDAPARAIPAPREITTQPRRSDQVFRTVVTIGGMSSLVILGLIALFLSIKGAHVLIDEKFGFITGSAWEVVTDETGNITQSKFGIGAMLVGTMLCALIAILVACQSLFLARST